MVPVKKHDLIILIAVYLIGLGLTGWYVFGSNYLAYPDAVREYDLYNMMRADDYWSVHNYVTTNFNEYDLQVSCLFTTLIPARIGNLFPINPEMFYKLYTVILLPMFPVMVYALARKFTGRANSFIAALFLMGWVSFIQEASNARTGIALVFYAAALLLVFSPTVNKYLRYGLLVLAGACIPLAHYSAAMLGALIIGGVLALSLIMKKQHWGHRKDLAIFLLPLVAMIAGWCYFGSNALLPKPGEAPGITVPIPPISGPGSWQPGMISGYVLGLSSPGTGTFILLAIAWATVAITAYGLITSLKSSDMPAEMKALGVLSFAVCAIFLVIVPLSNSYNVDRIYLQALAVLGMFFALGVSRLAGRIHAPAWAIGLPIVLVYGVLMKYYCLQYAIVENM